VLIFSTLAGTELLGFDETISVLTECAFVTVELDRRVFVIVDFNVEVPVLIKMTLAGTELVLFVKVV
jgi:hypothetical protein